MVYSSITSCILFNLCALRLLKLLRFPRQTFFPHLVFCFIVKSSIYLDLNVRFLQSLSLYLQIYVYVYVIYFILAVLFFIIVIYVNMHIKGTYISVCRRFFHKEYPYCFRKLYSKIQNILNGRVFLTLISKESMHTNIWIFKCCRLAILLARCSKYFWVQIAPW